MSVHQPMNVLLLLLEAVLSTDAVLPELTSVLFLHNKDLHAVPLLLLVITSTLSPRNVLNSLTTDAVET